MFIEERHHRIIEMLGNKKRLEVKDLSIQFGISEDSIRRDLRIMEEKGWLKRTYGGAILPSKVADTAPIMERESVEPEKKEEIAEIAASYIKENDTILLDGSTTVERLIPHLKKFNKLTVITNSVPIAFYLLDAKTNIKLFFLGGQIKREIGNSLSIETYRMIRTLNVDKAFMGICAISPKFGMSTPVMKEGLIKKAMIESAREVYFLVDSGKLGTKFLYKVGPVKPDYVIITDSGIREDLLKDFECLVKRGLRIIYKKN